MKEKTNCIICETMAMIDENRDRNILFVNCPRCGSFAITESAVSMFQKSEQKDKILAVSFWIRQNQDFKEHIDLIKMRSILIPFKKLTLVEQENNLLNFIGSQANKPDDYLERPISDLISIVGAFDEGNVIYVADSLKKQGFIIHQGFAYTWFDGKRHPLVDVLKAQLTPSGWKKYEEILKINKYDLVFMAMEYGNEILEKLYSEILKPTLKELGFDLKRLDEEPKAGIIDNHLRDEIRKSKFLIADLSTDNRGAYWEAGFAEGLGKNVIYICEETKFKEIHFDTNHCQTVKFRLDNFEEFKSRLITTIRATFTK